MKTNVYKYTCIPFYAFLCIWSIESSHAYLPSPPFIWENPYPRISKSIEGVLKLVVENFCQTYFYREYEKKNKRYKEDLKLFFILPKIVWTF